MMQPLSQGIPASHSGRSALEITTLAARISGKIIKDRYHTVKDVQLKGRADIVTDVDLAAETAILELLLAEYPNFGIVAEESEPIPSDTPYRWIVDPLDGTRNYAVGIPLFCTVIALAKGDDVILGTIFNSLTDEMFTAELGKGAYVNGDPISVSDKQEIQEALISFDLGQVDENAGLGLDLVRSLWPRIQGLRLLGSAALGLAYAASGRIDLYFHHHLSPWDIATGILLVHEAGGIVVDRQGRPADLSSTSVIASSPRLIDRFLLATEGSEWRK